MDGPTSDPERVRAIEAELSAHGLTTDLAEGPIGLASTATFSPSAIHHAQFTIDEHGCAGFRYRNPPVAAPAHIAATARRIRKTLTTIPGTASRWCGLWRGGSGCSHLPCKGTCNSEILLHPRSGDLSQPAIQVYLDDGVARIKHLDRS